MYPQSNKPKTSTQNDSEIKDILNKSETYQGFQRSTYKSVKHSTYFKVYDEIFKPFIGKPITFVEVGVLNGGSLFIWRDLFGPQARIIGVDLNPEAVRWNSYGFEIFIGDQSSETFWREFFNTVGAVDVVLDDGGHTFNQQISTTEQVLHNLKNGGICVIEDTHTSYMKGFGSEKYSFIKYVIQKINQINARFSGLNAEKQEDRIWGISIFESIVVFHVNKEATSIPSFPVTNSGRDLSAQDFRWKRNRSLALLDRFIDEKEVLKRSKYGRKILGKSRILLLAWINREQPQRKYFETD